MKCIVFSQTPHKTSVRLFLTVLYTWSLECCERCDMWRSRLHMTSEARYKSTRDKRHTDTFRASDTDHAVDTLVQRLLLLAHCSDFCSSNIQRWVDVFAFTLNEGRNNTYILWLSCCSLKVFTQLKAEYVCFVIQSIVIFYWNLY